MNTKDAEIIKILCKDARTSFSKIGRMLDIGTDTVLRRFRKLKTDGIVEQPIVILSSKNIGIKGWCGIYIAVKPGASVLAVKEKLTNLPQTYGIAPTTGDYDFYMEMGFRDISELDAFIITLKKIKEISAIDPIVYGTHDWPIPTLLTLDANFLELFLKIEK